MNANECKSRLLPAASSVHGPGWARGAPGPLHLRHPRALCTPSNPEPPPAPRAPRAPPPRPSTPAPQVPRPPRPPPGSPAPWAPPVPRAPPAPRASPALPGAAGPPFGPRANVYTGPAARPRARGNVNAGWGRPAGQGAAPTRGRGRLLHTYCVHGAPLCQAVAAPSRRCPSEGRCSGLCAGLARGGGGRAREGFLVEAPSKQRLNGEWERGGRGGESVLEGRACAKAGGGGRAQL